jgi:hypothetical protein
MSDIFNTLIEQTRAKEDVYDKYRDEHEDTKHWYARKEFLRHNFDKYFSEPNLSEDEQLRRSDRIDCMSRVWANMHFMGTTYPMKVMAEIQDMQYGMADVKKLLQEGEALAKRLEQGMSASKKPKN